MPLERKVVMLTKKVLIVDDKRDIIKVLKDYHNPFAALLNNMSMANEFRYEVEKNLPQDPSELAKNNGAQEDQTANVVIWTFPDGSSAMMRKDRIETLSASEE